MGKLLGPVFSSGGDGFVVIILAGLAVGGWLIKQGAIIFNGRVGGMIDMGINIAAVLALLGAVGKLFTKIMAFVGQ